MRFGKVTERWVSGEKRWLGAYVMHLGCSWSLRRFVKVVVDEDPSPDYFFYTVGSEVNSLGNLRYFEP